MTLQFPPVFLFLFLPLSVLQKKSREESEGEGSAVEILENRPFNDGAHSCGQYTYKVRWWLDQLIDESVVGGL